MLSELIERSQIAVKNIEEKKQKVVNFEEIELGIKHAQNLGLTNHITHYEAEKRRKIFESYEFPKITLDEAVRELTGYKSFRLETQGWLDTTDVRTGHNIGVHEYNYRRWFWTIASIKPTEYLKSHIPASILASMSRIKTLGLVNGFYAVGFPSAFIETKADPIIIAYISDRIVPYRENLEDDTTFYFVGKYN